MRAVRNGRGSIELDVADHAIQETFVDRWT